jgi:Cof subfamily protein (haloacid dehalogenase superfamily)
MAIKLLALDIDGTLLNPIGQLTPVTRRAIEEVRSRGILIVLVTGRRFGSARPVVIDLGLDLPLISHNGALTKHVSTLETILYHPLDLETARDVIAFGRDCGVDLICCDDPEGLGVMVLENISDENGSLHRYLAKYQDSMVRVSDLLEYLDHDPIQIMFSGRCDPMDQFADKLARALDGRIQLFKTRYRKGDLTILDALTPSASKGASVEEIALRYGIAREEIMAIGDNHNDITMLERAGIPVVMENAEDELKKMGYHVTSSNAEDGVAVAIERFILERELNL